MRARWIASSVICWLAGCTFQPGSSWSSLVEATVDARLAPSPARDLGNNTILTNLAHAVEVHEATLTVTDIHLETLEGALEASFDPANPPSGYSLCHNNHCHHDDGRLVSYAEIEAELSGASFEPVVSVIVRRDLDLLDEEPILGEVNPSDLPLVSLSRISVEVDGLALVATATGDGLPEAGLPISVDLPLDLQLTAALPETIDRSSPAEMAATIVLPIGGELFDDLAFSEEQDWILSDPSDPAVDTLLSHLLLALPEAQLQAHGKQQ